MKYGLLVCLLVVLVVAAPARVCPQRVTEERSPFALVERHGEPGERIFFVFSTALAKYILRNDGMGEITAPNGVRKVFNLKVGVKERIERVYSFEYEGDLLLLYQAGDSGYLARMNQRSRKLRTMTIDPNFTPPAIKDHRLVFNDGAVITLN